MSEEEQARRIMLEMIPGSEMHCVFKRIERTDAKPLVIVIYNFGMLVNPGSNFETELYQKFLTEKVRNFFEEALGLPIDEVEKFHQVEGWLCVEGILNTPDRMDITECNFFMIDHNGDPMFEVEYVQHLQTFGIFKNDAS